jgi:subtilisin family serine protease
VRKILVMRSHEWLRESAATSNFAVAAAPLEYYGLTRSAFLPTAPALLPLEMDQVGGPTLLAGEPDGFVMSVELDDDDVDTAEAELEAQLGSDFGGIFSDPMIQPFPANPVQPVGTNLDVERELNLAALTGANHRGKGVRVAVVDDGVDSAEVGVAGGWTPRPGIAPGTAAPGSHGTMCGLDVGIAAPQALIFDYPLLRVSGNLVPFLSDAIRAFSELMIFILQNPGPMVVTNSWGVFDRSTDAPPGNPQNYGANPNHPFNTITTALVQAGADVLFAAGNCGARGPDGRCGQADIGPGQSIHGANSHPSVLSVGAVDVNRQVLGYSSQGPGALSVQKPDIVAFSHFDYTGANPSFHLGTSAACPVAAGVVAALRSKPSARALPPSQIQDAVRQSATSPTGQWDADHGFGIIDASAAYALV